jgi:dTDP-4-amino-4,6-dideoxygalactose transaminase
VAAQYERALSGHPLLELPSSPRHCRRSWFVYPVKLSAIAGVRPFRDRVLAALRARGVACQAYFPAIHLQPYLQDSALVRKTALPHTEAASNSCLALPMFSSATTAQIDHVCAALLEVLDQESAVAQSA